MLSEEHELPYICCKGKMKKRQANERMCKADAVYFSHSLNRLTNNESLSVTMQDVSKVEPVPTNHMWCLHTLAHFSK